MSDAVQVLFEGVRSGGEFWGGTQCDFLLVPHDGARREVSIVLSDAAAAALAQKQSRENTEEFRAEAARSTGHDYIEKALAEGRFIASSVVVAADMVAA